MNEILEKVVPPSVLVFLAWIGSFEIRLRGKVSNKRMDDFTARLMRIEDLLISLNGGKRDGD